jgi:uncharacterized protein (TIGR02231 family)
MFMLAYLAAILVCAQGQPSVDIRQEQPEELAPQERDNEIHASSKIAQVTVYHGQALVIREATLPRGSGTTELVVTPLPQQTLDNSLYTEGADGIRVLSTRLRRRAVRDDTREEVRAKDALIATLDAESRQLQKKLSVQVQNLRLMEKLEGFTATSLSELTAQGKLDSDAILSLSNYVIAQRSESPTAQVELDEALRKTNEAIEFAKRERAELASGASRTELDAVIVVAREREIEGTVRLGYLVSGATWSPQYRLRAGRDNEPVQLEYLAAVTQQSGEDWPDAALTLSTASPSLDAAPPELLPLEMHVE